MEIFSTDLVGARAICYYDRTDCSKGYITDKGKVVSSWLDNDRNNIVFRQSD